MSKDVTSRKDDRAELTRLENEAAQAVQRLDAVLAVTDVMLAGLPLDELLQALLERLRVALGVDNAALLLLDESGQSLVMRAVRGPEEAVSQTIHVPLGQGFAGCVASERRPWVVDDITTIAVANPFLHQHLRSVVGVPLEAEGRVIGVVHVGTVEPHHFIDDDVRLLELVADRAARAIEATQLREMERRLEREVAERAEQLERTFEAMGDGVIIYDAKGQIIRQNAAIRTLLGFDRLPGYDDLPFAERTQLLDVRDAYGRPMSSKDLAPMRALRGEVLTGERALALHTRSLDGRRIEVSVSAAPVRDADGGIAGAVAVYRDVTARSALERAQQVNERRFRAIFEQAAVGMAEVSLDGHWLRVNDALCQLTGYSREELLNGTFQDITSPEDLDADLALVQRLVAGRSDTYTLEKRYLRRDGSSVWVNLTVSIMRDGAGEPLYFIAVIDDISARNRAEEQRIQALAEEEALATRLRAVLDALPVSVIIADAEGRLVDANAAFYRNWGANAPLVGSVPEYESYEGYRAGTRVRLGAADWPLARALATGESVPGTEVDISDFDHRQKTLLISSAPVRAASGTLTGAVVVEVDISVLKHAEEALRDLNATLERRVGQRTAELQVANDELEAFAYSVSHDLRAPLRAMEGFAQALAEDYAADLDEHARQYTQRIVSAAARMDRLIQDLLAYSRLTRDEVTPRRVDLEAVVATVLEAFTADIHAHNAEVAVEHPLPSVMGNRVILRQVMGNLVGNALTYVAPGVSPQVRICAAASPVGSPASDVSGKGADPAARARPMVRVSVEDNGIGIAPEHQERIFRVFERLHGVEEFPGTGIELALVKKGIERMGGRVGVESTPGVGSRFWFELPQAESNLPPLDGSAAHSERASAR